MRGRITVILTLWFLFIGCQPTEQGESPFSFRDDGAAFTIFEKGNAVLSILYERVNPPEGMDESYWRSNYIHPLYGLDGEVLTDDFPEDHPHHRGVFWTWPDVTYGDREVDPWALRGARQLFRHWAGKETGSDYANVEFVGGWRLEEGWDPFVEERISVTVHPADEGGRAIDFDLRFRNVSNEVVTLRGRGDTGYGGFNIRPDGGRSGIRITTAEGVMEEDALVVDSGWADFSSRVSGEGDIAGFALFQHPENPGFPHTGWILRYYGFLGVSWPQFERLELAPDEDFQLSYRVYIHRGDAEAADVAKRYDTFIEEAARNREGAEIPSRST